MYLKKCGIVLNQRRLKTLIYRIKFHLKFWAFLICKGNKNVSVIDKKR